MAHKKAGSSSKNGRDSVGQRLGVKAGDGQLVSAGTIIVRQRGQTFLASTGTGLARDYTVFATVTGHVRFEHASKAKKRIRVVAADAVAAEAVKETPTVNVEGAGPVAESASPAPRRTRKASAAAADVPAAEA
jgi:large subunit ribosomal protein L27